MIGNVGVVGRVADHDVLAGLGVAVHVELRGLPSAEREYEARATLTPPVTDCLPTTVKRLVWMQFAARPV